MYKLLILLFFFSTFAFGQGNTPVTNQANPVEMEEQVQQKKQSKLLNEKEINLQQQMFQNEINQMHSTFNAVSWSTVRKTPTAQQQKELEVRLNRIEKINSESFEYHLFKYQVGNYDFSEIEHLKTAAALKPLHPDVLSEMTAYAYIEEDESLLKKYLLRYADYNFFNNDIELFAKNLLLSLPENTFLITHGVNDTYPLLIQQKIKNVREDVEIISLDHLQSKDYRKNLKKKGFKMPKSNIIDTSFFGEFMHLNKTKNIVVAPSVPRYYLEKGKQISSLGLGYSMFGPEQKDYNINLYKNKLKKKISEAVFYKKENNELVGNYLPYLFEVRNQYIVKMDVRAIDEIEKLILRIAKRSNKESEVKALLFK